MIEIKLLFGFLSLMAFSLFIEKLFVLPPGSVSTPVVTVMILSLFIYLTICAILGEKGTHQTNDIIFECSDNIPLCKYNEENDIGSCSIDSVNIDGCFDG